MGKKDKLFKETLKLAGYKEYSQYIEDSLKPLGFSSSLDEVFYELKLKLFYALHQEVLNSGASYDPEIAFGSIISDLTETYDNVHPTLLELQRKIQSGDR